MNCQRFENVVSELARSQMMEADVRDEALVHGDACEDCGARLRDEQMLTRGLQSLAAEMESLAAPGDIETTLREAFRRRQVAVPVSVGQRSSRYWLAAVAAVLLIAISVAALRWRVDQVDPPRQAMVGGAAQSEDTAEAQPSNSPVKDVESQADNVSPKREAPKKVRRTGSRRAANTEVANHVTREIATDFMPLGYMNAANFQDGGQIVRVELPRSALASFGLPANMDRYNEKVKADVLLGVDGLAHAIRFVQ